MTTETVHHGDTLAADDVPEPIDHGANHDTLYVKLFVGLVIVTAIEVALSYADLPTAVFLPSLLFLMAVKFFAIVSVFMHLRFETSKIFGALFYVGLAFALGVYLATLTTYEFWAK